MVKKDIVWFDEVAKDDVGLVGGKGANLGEMTKAQFPIPFGFVVTSNAYFDYVKNHKLDAKIKQILGYINYENPVELHQVSREIKKLIESHEIPTELAHKIVKYYEELTLKEQKYFQKTPNQLTKLTHKIKSLYKNPLVAVRSSATAEDLPDASFAGQQETFLNVQGEHHLLAKVRSCWASLFTERAIYYRHQKGFDHFKVGLAAVVQRMVQSDKSGIAFSIDPVTNDKTKILIEAIYGLGEYIVGGKVTPDHYEVDKKSYVILKEEIVYQNIKYVRAGVDNEEVKLSKKEGSQKKLSNEEIEKVALLVADIEKHYYFPQDIEWAIEGPKVFIVQARPITTIKSIDAGNKAELKNPTGQTTHTPILTGSPASPGIGVGVAKIIFSPDEIEKIKKGDILIAPQTNPDYVPAMKKAAAIVTEKGGRTSHAAIVSRELGIPAVVGAENATKVLKNSLLYSVNGGTGEVFKGSILTASQARESHRHEEDKKHHQKTKTKVYVNLAEPESAGRVSQMDVDGIGLLRAEFMMAAIGTHPKQFVKEGKQEIFINRLYHDLMKFVSAFDPKPVIYRASDFKTNEYRNMKGGDKFEPKEENPMLGFRGAARYIADPQVFNMELEALNRVWQKGHKNLHLMIPFLRAPWELIKIKEIVTASGLFTYPEFKFYIMAEVPSCALTLEDFIALGVTGVSIGTNDLTMMLLGVDRDNEHVAQLYDERSPVVLATLTHIVETCVQRGVTVSICGQAASDYPQVVETLIKAGVTSVSVNPDAIGRTRELIHSIETRV